MEIRGESLLGVFSGLPDPRSARGIRPRLEAIIVISVLAFISDANDCVEIREYGLATEDWLRGFLNLKHGIPSVDTFERIFCLLDAQVWQARFRQWTPEVALGESNEAEDEILAIDGTTRRWRDVSKGIDALHTVSVGSS